MFRCLVCRFDLWFAEWCLLVVAFCLARLLCILDWWSLFVVSFDIGFMSVLYFLMCLFCVVVGLLIWLFFGFVGCYVKIVVGSYWLCLLLFCDLLIVCLWVWLAFVRVIAVVCRLAYSWLFDLLFWFAVCLFVGLDLVVRLLVWIVIFAWLCGFAGWVG